MNNSKKWYSANYCLEKKPNRYCLLIQSISSLLNTVNGVRIKHYLSYH